MSSTLFSLQYNSIVQDTFNSWKEEDEDILIVTSDGQRLSASRKILSIFSNLMSILLENRNGGKTTILSLDFTSSDVCALLDLIRNGQTSLENGDMFYEVISLAKTMGISLTNVDIMTSGNRDNCNILEDTADDEELYTLEELRDKESITFPSNMMIQIEKEGSLNDINSSAKNIANDFVSCLFCPKTFKSKNKLRCHTMCHTTYTCDICQKGFRFPSLLKNHVASCKAQQKVCYICQKEIIPNDDLECSICKNECSSNEDSLNHSMNKSYASLFQITLLNSKYSHGTLDELNITVRPTIV